MANASKNVLAKPQSFIVRPAPGWIDVAHQELKEILQNPLSKYKFIPETFASGGAIRVKNCDFRQGIEVTMRLLTAHDVEWIVAEGSCISEAALDRRLGLIPFASFLSAAALEKNASPLHLQTQCKHSFVGSSRMLKDRFFAAVKSQGLELTLAVEQGEASEEETPEIPLSVASGRPSLRVKLTLIANKLVLTVSMAGEPLYKRGYKAVLAATAPLPEHHGAAAFRWLHYHAFESKPKRASQGMMVVPFAGTGTLGFEALLGLAGGSNGLFSRCFAFETFAAAPEATAAFIRKGLRQKCRVAVTAAAAQVRFSEINDQAFDVLNKNVANFAAAIGVPAEKIFGTPVQGDFFSMKLVMASDDYLLLNPPYGIRLAKGSSAPSLFGKIGARISQLRKANPKAQMLGYCLCPDERTWSALLKSMTGLESKTRHFTQGGIDMRIVAFRAK